MVGVLGRAVLGLGVTAGMSFVAACGPNTTGNASSSGTSGQMQTPDAGPPRQAPEIGKGDHTAASVTFTTIATAADGLNYPRDLGFHNSRPNELWVVSQLDDSTLTITNVGMPNQLIEKRIDAFSLHFMEEASSMAFGSPDIFATCHESNNTYNNQAPPNNFMGPALWSADMGIYAVEDPIGLGSHLDMLHESPWCMGIAWQMDNIYWVFDGHDGSIVMYDFQMDHGPGYDDHSDGIIHRYVLGQVLRVPDVPSHMEFNPADNNLYIVDTGHQRVAKLDITSGTPGPRLPAKERGTEHMRYDDAMLVDVVSAASLHLDTPSGLALHNNYIYVSDLALSRISAFTMEGELVNHLDTGLPTGSLMGITFGPDNKLYFVDAPGNRVIRIDVPE